MDERAFEDECNERRLKITEEVSEIIAWLRANPDAPKHARRQVFDVWSALEAEYNRLGEQMFAALFERLERERKPK